MIIFFVAIGFPTLINTSPSLGYAGINFTPVTTFYQEAYAEMELQETMFWYSYNPLLFDSYTYKWLVSLAPPEYPPDDPFTRYLETEIEFGVGLVKQLLTEPMIPQAYAIHNSPVLEQNQWQFREHRQVAITPLHTITTNATDGDLIVRSGVNQGTGYLFKCFDANEVSGKVFRINYESYDNISTNPPTSVDVEFLDGCYDASSLTDCVDLGARISKGVGDFYTTSRCSIANAVKFQK